MLLSAMRQPLSPEMIAESPGKLFRTPHDVLFSPHRARNSRSGCRPSHGPIGKWGCQRRMKYVRVVCVSPVALCCRAGDLCSAAVAVFVSPASARPHHRRRAARYAHHASHHAMPPRSCIASSSPASSRAASRWRARRDCAMRARRRCRHPGAATAERNASAWRRDAPVAGMRAHRRQLRRRIGPRRPRRAAISAAIRPAAAACGARAS